MALQKLVATGEAVSVQETTFSVDAPGRFVCSTWDEATGSGGRPLDAVVVGAGMYGAYCATRIFREHPHKRVLVLDAGRFLVSEHVQNLGRIGLDVPDPIRPADDPGVARKLVWGMPWRGNVDFPGLAYCLGGKSLYYFYDGAFTSEPFPLQRSFPEWHRGLGSTYHESGTLWMGDDPVTSVTNRLGRFHHVANAYACDQSVFPTVGSVNPVLTGLTLARRLAAQLPI